MVVTSSGIGYNIKTRLIAEEERIVYMSITTTEFKNNPDKYIFLASKEDIFIVDHGRTVVKLSNPNQNRVDIAKSLFGVLSNDVTLEEAREEYLSKV